jgi:multidrug efflux system membrane fusion protein
MFIRFARAACITAISLLSLACAEPAHGAAETATPVKVQRVEALPSASSTRYSGSLEPSIRIELAFKVGGYVDMLGQVSTPQGKRALDKGDFVTKGTVLARIRAADYTQKLATARAAVSEARARAVLAKADLDRTKKLFELGAITQAQLDSKIASSDSANAQYESAVARTGEAQLSVGDTVLRAPQDGVVLKRHVEVGTLMSPGQPVITLADVRSVKAVFGAPQSAVERLNVGSPVKVIVAGESNDTDRQLEAQVTRIAPYADANGRLFSIEAALPNPNGELRPGAVVSVHVPHAADGGDGLRIPLNAVIRSPRDPNGFSVFVLEGDAPRSAARIRDVRLGQVIGNSVTVTDGLALNQRVVTVGGSLLRDGATAVVIR